MGCCTLELIFFFFFLNNVVMEECVGMTSLQSNAKHSNGDLVGHWNAAITFMESAERYCFDVSGKKHGSGIAEHREVGVKQSGK